MELIGKAVDRVDGRVKVTGTARYTAEFSLPQLAHSVLLHSTIAKGRIRAIDTQAAEALPGVLAVIIHLNAPKLHEIPKDLKPTEGKTGQRLIPLQDATIRYHGQHIGVAIAETLEQANYAASLVQVDYEPEEPIVDMMTQLSQAHQPDDYLGQGADQSRGDVDSALAQAEIRIERSYSTPIEHSSPIELSATIATWDGDQLTLYDSTQGVSSTATIVSTVLGIPKENVRVISHYLGGAFGCKSFTWPHTILAAIAARHVNRPVKLELTRQQMFASIGYRPRTLQHMTLGATKDGQLTAIRHASTNQAATYEDYTETCGSQTPVLYACPNVSVTHRVIGVDLGKPTIMRAPGEAPGSFVLESAMDELAYELCLDPLELRLRNYAQKDPQQNLPWSSKSLRECYRQGAERFGWARRNPTVRSMRDGNMLVGQGMATTTYEVFRRPATATVQILADGTARGLSSTQELGTGTYTIMTQIVADAVGIAVNSVRFDLGDTKLPKSPNSDGSSTAASTGSAVYLAAKEARRQLIEKAIQDPASPLHHLDITQVMVQDGRCYAKDNPAQGETYADILKRHDMDCIEATCQAQSGSEQKQYSMYAFGAHFAEVQVNPDSGEVQVTRFVTSIAAGRILNAKTARSQIIGGVVFGIGMALLEHTVVDERSGHFVNPDLGEYYVPVNTDIPAIDAFFVEEDDPHVNPIGVKGVGEIGTIGSAAAVANAVYHATGKRIRNLPITLDKLL